MSQLSKEWIRGEILKCGTDPTYFIKKYVMIQHPVRGLIKFDTFDYQSELIDAYQKHRFNIVLKARQLGISEITAAYATWLMMFHRDKNILVVATKRETAKNIIRKVHVAITNMPKWLMLGNVVTDNVYSIELSTGSRIKATSSSKDAGRSEAVSLLILDEAAHIEKMAELWTGLLPTVQAGGKVMILSTPNGVGNTFHEIWEDATAGANDFHGTELMWYLHPERAVSLRDDPGVIGGKTSPWFEKETRGMSIRDIAQELCCNFNSSGDNVIASTMLDWILQNTITPAISFEHTDRNLHVFSPSDPNGKYLISADVARGDGADYSSAHVFEAETMDQVAEYKGKIPPDEFAEVLCRLGWTYNTAPLVVENNSIGLACLEHIRDSQYEAVYYSRKNDLKPGEIVNTSLGHPDIHQMTAGFSTTSRTRPLILSKLEEYIRNRTMVVRSMRTLEEFRHWIWKNGRAEAQRGWNDDLIMAAAIGAWIRDTFLAPQFMSSEHSRMMLGATSVKRRDNTEVPGATKDPRFVRNNERLGTGMFGPNHNPYEMTVGPGRVIDIGWLIKSG